MNLERYIGLTSSLWRTRVCLVDVEMVTDSIE